MVGRGASEAVPPRAVLHQGHARGELLRRQTLSILGLSTLYPRRGNLFIFNDSI